MCIVDQIGSESSDRAHGRTRQPLHRTARYDPRQHVLFVDRLLKEWNCRNVVYLVDLRPINRDAERLPPIWRQDHAKRSTARFLRCKVRIASTREQYLAQDLISPLWISKPIARYSLCR